MPDMSGASPRRWRTVRLLPPAALLLMLIGYCLWSQTGGEKGEPHMDESSRGETKRKVGLVYDPAYLEHQTAPGHPERPARLTAIIRGLKESGLYAKLLKIEPRPAPEKWVRSVHTAEYMKRAKAGCAAGLKYLDTPDVSISGKSYEVALLAAGAGLAALDAVAEGKVRAVFCAVRPPGHHAMPDEALGFCIFNNIAIAARYAQQKHGWKKVLIVDFDVHHGNSTQAVFYADGSVLHFGIHRHPFYPGTGAAEKEGQGEGLGYNINVPLPAGSGISAYRKAFAERLKPAALKFKPDIVLISAGFDAHQDDPLGGMKLTSQDYGELTGMVKEIADECCEGRIVSFLEGGYDLDALAEAGAAHVKALMAR